MTDADTIERRIRPAQRPASPNRRAWRRFRSKRAAMAGFWSLVLLAAAVLAWPLALRAVAQFGPRGAHFAAQLQPDQLSDEQFSPPGPTHWFGTDVHGRDLFSRVMFGARISLFIGVTGAIVSLVIGVLWGALAGYAGGKIDGLLMRIVDILYALPSIIFVIVLMTTFESASKHLLTRAGADSLQGAARLFLLVIGLGSVSWLNMARIVRGQVLSLRERPFVEASRALGATPVRILCTHILPNIMGVVIVYLTLTVPAIILYESFLSYLGLGIEPPMASWGSLIAEGADQINPIRIYWWLIVFPGAFLVASLLALTYVGDGLRNAWDFRIEGS